MKENFNLKETTSRKLRQNISYEEAFQACSDAVLLSPAYQTCSGVVNSTTEYSVVGCAEDTVVSFYKFI